ncbi:MAG: hypothetical protein R3246_14015, partial [Acidimicrobiia bacterium]|nr:hypothetical protein [Acidimicrobiia bacterium]
DSAAFTEEIVYGFKVGKGLLEVLQELMDMTGYSFRMNPDLSLDIWIQRGTDRTATVVYDEPPALEIVSSSYTRIMPAATTLLIETQNGLSEAKDAAGVTAYGSRRIGTTTGTAPTFEGLASFVTTTFDKHGNEKQELTLSTHGPAGLEPYADYDIGDWITAPDDEGVAREWRVTAIQMEMLEDGQPLWTVTLLREDAPA